MAVRDVPGTFRELIDLEIARFRRKRFVRLTFNKTLEDRFERENAKQRSYRLWLEGLIAIVVFNLCLLADFLLVQDRALIEAIKRSELVTPIALIVNAMMRLRLPGWAREGSIAAGMTIIAWINLHVEGGTTPARAMYQIMSVLITILFVNVVMRLRFPYAVTSTVLMAAAGCWYGLTSMGLKVSEQIVGLSMLGLGSAMTLTAVYSMEWQERLNYLLYLDSEMKSAELHRISNIDRLTELPNRRAFEERFDALWTKGMLLQEPLSVVVVDIDHFKMVNDIHGHLYGDEVLRRVAGLLTTALRTNGMAARFGGEEFVVLLPGLAEEAAMDVAERVRSMVEELGSAGIKPGLMDPTQRVTVSCGVSTCVPDDALNREKLLRHADGALYRAKESGRNRVDFQECQQRPARG